MKLYYEIETDKRMDAHGEEIISTDAITYEADDREIYKIGVYHLPYAEQQEKMLAAWDNEFSDERKAQAVAETMKFFGDEVYDHFRQTALDSVFSPTSGESGKVDKVIEEKQKAPHSANDEGKSLLCVPDRADGKQYAQKKLKAFVENLCAEIRKETAKEIFTGLYKEIDALLFQKSKTTRSGEETGACRQLSEIKEMLLENAQKFGVEVGE